MKVLSIDFDADGIKQAFLRFMSCPDFSPSTYQVTFYFRNKRFYW